MRPDTEKRLKDFSRDISAKICEILWRPEGEVFTDSLMDNLRNNNKERRVLRCRNIFVIPAGIPMTLKKEILNTESNREQLLRIFRTTGAALYAA